MKIRKSAEEWVAEYISELECERDSYKDEAAEWKIRYQAALAELQRVKATLEVV